MAFEGLSDNIHKVTNKVEDYGLSTAEYFKLRLFKSAMKAGISLVNLLVFGSLFLFVLLFLSIGAAFWLGTFFEHGYVGFFIMGGFYGIFVILMFIFGRDIIRKNMLFKFSGLLYDAEDIAPKVAAEKEIDEFEDTMKEKVLDNEEKEEIKA